MFNYHKTKNPTKPNRQSIRLKGYDYSSPGYYFITACTQNRECLFGEIVGANHDSPVPKMVLNECGKIVNDVLNSLPDQYKQIELDLFQIMPNHIHMIIIIHPMGAIHESPLPKLSNRRFIKRGDQRELLPQCIGYFKMNSSKQINQYVRAHHDSTNVRAHHDAPKKIWQRNYYEHIIRTEIDLEKIREYIQINPRMWDRDRNNPAIRRTQPKTPVVGTTACCDRQSQRLTGKNTVTYE